jgi:FAR1 DNA-binding domain
MKFVCSKYEFEKRQKIQEMPIDDPNRPKTPEKVRTFTRVGCNASFRIKLIEGIIWEVSVFEENHNHPLVTSPSKRRNLRSQKCISNEQTETIINLSAQNVRTTQILEYIAMHCGGKGNLWFKKQDVSNRIVGIKKKIIGADVSTIVLHFKKKQEENPEFFYAIEPDETGVVKNIFWVDGRGRRAYKEFDDVVMFDTTY